MDCGGAPLDPLFTSLRQISPMRFPKEADRGVGRGPGGPPYNFIVGGGASR
jgi:hypothetical protein